MALEDTERGRLNNGTDSKRITVLYVDQAVAFGGSIVVIGCLVEGIDKTRYRPLVVGEMDAAILQHHIKDHADIFYISRMFNYALTARIVKRISRFPGPLLRKLLVYTVSAVRGLANMAYGAKLVRLILNEHVDIVHVNNGMGNLAPIIAATILRRKCIVHFHGVEKPGRIPGLFIKKISRFIAVSEYLKKCLVENHISEDRITVIHNPVRFRTVQQCTRERVRHRYSILPGQRVFGIIGRIMRWKGHIEFLKAANIVLRTIPEAKALIVGDFSDGDIEYQTLITRMAESSEFSDRIIMSGYVNDVEELYSIMDVCVHTSIEPEPFGLVITEAMAQGVPMVASNRGAPREIINDGVDGFLVDPTASQAVASVIISLLSNERLRQRIGDKGRQRVQQKEYQISNYAQAMEAVYMEVLVECRNPRP